MLKLLKLLNSIHILIFCLVFTHISNAQTMSTPLYQNKKFIVYKDSIVQGKFTAKALSSTKLTSNYQSPANQFKSNDIAFKFSINGKDNEMPSGTDHHFICTATNGACETPVIKFGTQLKDNVNVKDNTYLAPNAKFVVSVDMSDVFNDFNKQGYYTTFNGNKIYKEDFKGVYIAGNSSPLIWDFDNLVNHPQLQLKDEKGNHVYSTTLVLNAQEDEKKTNANWELTKDISLYPQYKSGYPISDALYNMSLEEMIKAIEPDSTFRTGKEWAGVWTRDISYSIILSMAYMQPQVAINSLLRKVNGKKRIIQDTGTGGAWPCSTDRMIWAVAAYEVYKATGNKEWLQQAYVIIKNSIEDDEHVAYDKTTGLVRGESSFLDWREQTYPKWMQPADIYESECLGTNAVHYEANKVLAQMALLLNHQDVAAKHEAIALQIKNGINKYLWIPAKGYYAQYLYGRNYKIVSPRSEALGEALCIIWNIADSAKQKEMIANMPVTDFGTTCIYPQIPNIPPYHNDAVWPFVQTYYTWAAARAGNEKAVMQSIADIYRPAALFVTNKENLVAENGDFAGTQINSSNMLWSLSGNISLVHKVLFGIKFESNELTFHPFVPEALKGERSLDNFKYRNSILNIQMNGFGNKISSFTIDGKPTSAYVIPSTLKGTHTIHIQLSNKNTINNTINHQPVYFSLAAPVVLPDKNKLTWQPVKDAVSCSIFKNGKQIASVQTNSFNIEKNGTAEYQVMAVDKNKVTSFASEPILIADDKNVKTFEAENFALKSDSAYKGFTGERFVEISTSLNRNLSFKVTIENPGFYSIDFRYANGNGPTNTENKCAIRTLKVDNRETGTVVFPQRGKNEWSNWGYSNSVKVYLPKGKHVISLSFEDFDNNMNGIINQAMIDNLRVIMLDE
ncbi:Bacterial alpha-L-rhamnosidase [Ginsengibacter hankyongi]|uniref:Bacterial alpha-L-rhamnosidase n=1 Tax=Ginsengibacter hankyongi TaxID=2607284 RepID=A0A5J5IBI6_9BACT|nr:family 78 glycoside hydrolase catalytic domain [Ginsengibacter hankyongi]KAA9036297.1 Bacterial alpha-L-rhamnosidase [Ginsengibacter hankyongi]